MGIRTIVEDVWVVQKENKNGEVVGVVFEAEEVAELTNRLSRNFDGWFWVKHYQRIESIEGLHCLDSYSVRGCGTNDTKDLVASEAVVVRSQQVDEDPDMTDLAKGLVSTPTRP